jgi:hypothetical protein
LPECINAGDYCEGKEKKEDEEEGEKDKPHKRLVDNGCHLEEGKVDRKSYEDDNTCE